MHIMRKLVYAVKMLRERGIGFFWTYFVESVWFDLRHGTRTFARVPKDEQAINGSNTEVDEGLLYVASFTSVTRKTVALARKILGPARFSQAQFFDLGCGKGKALLVFAELYGAKQAHSAIGVEYDPDLTKRAIENIEKCDFAKGRVDVFTDSAVNLREYAQSQTLVIYLYNSFQGETLRSVLDVLRDIPHVLIYVDPAEREVLSEYDYQFHYDAKGRYNADTWLVASSGLEPEPH
jgi:SAM-dependent methyltransferase